METLAVLIFLIGYAAIVIEHNIHVNKSASALLMGTLIWSVISFSGKPILEIENELLHHLGEISGILFFLLGAMTIVELVDTFHGFDLLTNNIKTSDKRSLLWIIAIVTFFLSAVLDNLTTTIVMVTLLRKLITQHQERLLYVGLVVIAANAGGAFSPIGDVTTTMLWIGGQVSTVALIKMVFIPSVISLLVPLAFLSFQVKGKLAVRNIDKNTGNSLEKTVFFVLGIGGLLFVPVFKTLTHLPPYMGMLMVLSILWIVSEIFGIKKQEEHKKRYSIYHALEKLDVPTILFFLGILMAVAGLQSLGTLSNAASWISDVLGNQNIVVTVIGLLSSVVDNVPLVAACMGMFNMEQFPSDHSFWTLLAYCAGTGGSILIIGSAAGVAAMGMEKISFVWYLKKISWLALMGYLAGVGLFMIYS